MIKSLFIILLLISLNNFSLANESIYVPQVDEIKIDFEKYKIYK